jgi:hypothetical protein
MLLELKSVYRLTNYSIFKFVRNSGLSHKQTEQRPYLKKSIVTLYLSITRRSRRKKLPGAVLKIFVGDRLVIDKAQHDNKFL